MQSEITLSPSLATPATPPKSRAGRTVLDVRSQLRRSILTGEYAPGSPLPALALAKQFGVSRTPLREALRMLQEEGLVVVESNQRARVVTWSPDELEAIFSERILLSSLCTRLTVPYLADRDLDRMRALESEMERATAAQDHDSWQQADIDFHECHLALAPPALRADLKRLYDRALLFRLVWLDEHRFAFSIAHDDHAAILGACTARDPDGAAGATSNHLARVALTLMAQLAPDRDPAAIREALRLATGDLFRSPVSHRHADDEVKEIA